MIAVAFAKVDRLDDQIAQPGTFGDDDLSGVGISFRGLRPQRLEGLDSGLGLGLPRPRRLANPFQLLGKGPLAGLFLLLFKSQALLFLLEP